MFELLKLNDTELALHKAVLAEPDNDVPRLMFADALLENAGLASFDGSDFVADGRQAWAEFIRTQVILDKWKDPLACPECGTRYDMSIEPDGHGEGGAFKPTAELWCARDHCWKYGTHAELRGKERDLLGDGLGGSCLINLDTILSLPLLQMLRRARRNRHMERPFRWDHRRGFINKVECRMEDWADLDVGIGPATVRRYPIERVNVLDLHPTSSGGLTFWMWIGLPTHIYGAFRFRQAMIFPTAKEARDELSLAMIRWAKSR